MAETINAGHAKHRALVAFPGVTPGSTMTGRLLCIGGRNRAKDGVLPDDGPELVRRVTFEAPVVDRGLHSDRLVLVVYGPVA